MYTKMFNFIRNQSGQLKQKTAFPVTEAKNTSPRVTLVRGECQRLRSRVGDPQLVETTAKKALQDQGISGSGGPVSLTHRTSAVQHAPCSLTAPPRGLNPQGTLGFSGVRHGWERAQGWGAQ